MPRRAFIAIPAFLALLAAPAARADGVLADLEAAAQTYEDTAEALPETNECLPIIVGRTQDASIFYQYCSDAAREKQAAPVQISKNFAVPAGLARRFNFWRSVYFLWSPDQYVLHCTAYPELALAVVDVSSEDDSPKAAHRRTKVAKELMDGQKDAFRHLLLQLDALARKGDLDDAELTPAMQRVVDEMAHIPDADKYRHAARTLRDQRGQREYIAKGLEMASRYLPSIEAAFAAEGIPEELASLAFVESSFNLGAESKVGASGVFQIMPTTAKEQMQVSAAADERRDPIKAAKAAAHLLKQYYNILGNWALAVTAYNNGVGGVQAAVKATRSKDLEDLIAHHQGKGFGFASKNYFTEFLAVLATLQESASVFPDVELDEPMVFRVVKLPKEAPLAAIARDYGVTEDAILALNPDVSKEWVGGGGPLPKGFRLKLPPEEASTALVLPGDLEHP